MIADSSGAYRVLETSHPPTYYIPPKDVDMQLNPSSGSSYCEWKGSASYYDAPGKPKVAWYYAKPSSSFEPIANYVCFYPSKVDKATVGEETVTAQPGNFPGSILMLMRSVSAFSNGSTSQLCNVCGRCALHLNKVVGLCCYPMHWSKLYWFLQVISMVGGSHPNLWAHSRAPQEQWAGDTPCTNMVTGHIPAA